MKIYFKTFGCRTNIYDSEVMKNSLKNHEICDDETKADVIVINSCTVTNGADSDVRNYINKANKNGKKVFLTGCGAISRGKELFDNGKVFGVFGSSKKENITEIIEKNIKFIDLGDINKSQNSIVKNFKKYTKAFVKIQEGCDFNCSYCIIPSVRGHARSKDESIILKEVLNLANNGFSEIVLTGTNIGSYGKDTRTSLSKLLKKLSQINGIKRIRLGSLEPSQIDDEFKELLNEKWLEKHLHIALQHTSETMLKIMRRRNKAFKDIELFNELASKGYALGTDFIVGHPGESDKIWLEALNNFKSFPLTHIHAFVYSPRDNTHSATLKIDVDGKIAKERLKTLQDIVEQNNFEFRKKHYNELNVLVEQKNGDFFTGFDEYYNKIYIKSDKDLTHNWIKVKKYEIEKRGNFTNF